MRQTKINVTTAADGTATAYGPAVTGVVYAIQLVDGDLADGVDVTITSENENISIPILVHADFNTDLIKYPRVVQSLDTDGSALTSHALPLIYGRTKVVIAAGGNAKSGSVIIYSLEM